MTETPTAGARTSLVRLLLLASALAGLFAMHGLGEPGTAHHAAESSHAAVAMTGEQPGHTSPDHMGEGASAAAETRGDTTARTTVSAPSDAGSGAAGLCMAVLAGVLFALAGLRAWGRLPAVAALRLVSGVRLAATARERAPPRLVHLSICRC